MQTIANKLFNKLAANSTHRILALSLLPLHFSIWSQQDPILSKALFLAHIGIFLLWQPFISQKTQIQTRPTIIALLAIFGIIYLGGGWIQIIWIVFLLGIVSSYRLTSTRDKLIYLLIIGLLMLELFGILIPNGLPERLLNSAAHTELIPQNYIVYLILSLNILILVLPAKSSSFRNYAADLLYSIITVGVIILIAMATLLWMLLGQYNYYLALIIALLMLAGILVAFNLIFRPGSETSLTAQLWDRYLLNLGTPFETSLIAAAQASEGTEDPTEYLYTALESLSNLDWINGFAWRIDSQKKSVGDSDGYANTLQAGELELVLYSQQPLGTAMRKHALLLIQLVEIFYTAKQREQSLLRRAHMEAIYDTGARLTHDIKNLVQSLTLMLSAANADAMNEQGRQLFFKNLEIITQRLQHTLAKLRNPETLSEKSRLLTDWWQAVQQREGEHNYLSFNSDIQHDVEIPEELFGSVLENLLNNAKKKQNNDARLQIVITLISTRTQLQLSVQDSGAAVPQQIARQLLNAPVKSRSGFGIGLYQAAKQANAHGFALILAENRDGRVRFELQKQAG